MLRSKAPAGGKDIPAVAEGLAVWRTELERLGDCPLGGHLGPGTGLKVSGEGWVMQEQQQQLHRSDDP